MKKIVYLVYWRKEAKWARKIDGGSCVRLSWVDDHRKATHWGGTGPLKQSFNSGVFSRSGPVFSDLEVHIFEEILQCEGFETAVNFLNG